MRTFLNKIINILLPERHNYKIVRASKKLFITPSVYSIDGLTVQYLLEFKHEKVRACIHEAKFHDNTRAQALLGATIAQFIETSLIKYDLVVPIPLSKERARARGYCQVEQILKAGNVPFKTDILKRVDRPAQTSLTKEQRLQNVQGSFSVDSAKEDLIRNAHILLVDDVVTTGATLRAAQAALVPHQPTSITCLALAH